ncbi:MAG: transposase [Bacteroidota bacterium]|nr:transposase [Bacteroidota bacterium]
MVLETGKYYHFYNRSNNEESLFKKDQNYIFFLERYRHYLQDSVSTLAYCLMPTHFHFLIKIVTNDCAALKRNIAALLGGYTKAINETCNRHGSLFQPRSKARRVDDEFYLLTLISYIHQNPVRAQLVKRMAEWQYSSYRDLTGLRNGSLPDRQFIMQHFQHLSDFKKYSEEMITTVKKEYWI